MDSRAGGIGVPDLHHDVLDVMPHCVLVFCGSCRPSEVLHHSSEAMEVGRVVMTQTFVIGPKQKVEGVLCVEDWEGLGEGLLVYQR